MAAQAPIPPSGVHLLGSRLPTRTGGKGLTTNGSIAFPNASALLLEASLDSPAFRAFVAYINDQVDGMDRWLDTYSRSVGKMTHDVLALEATIQSAIASMVPRPIVAEATIDNDYTLVALKRASDAYRAWWLQGLQLMRKTATSAALHRVRDFQNTNVRTFYARRRKLESTQKAYDLALARFSAIAKSKDPATIMEEAKTLHQHRHEYILACFAFCVEIPTFRFALDSMLTHISTDLWSEIQSTRQPPSPQTTQQIQQTSRDIQRIRVWCQDMDRFSESFLNEIRIVASDVTEHTRSLYPPVQDVQYFAASTVSLLGLHGPVNLSVVSAHQGQPDHVMAHEYQGWLFYKSMPANSSRSSRATWVRRWFYCRDGIFGWLVQGPHGVLQSDEIGVLLCGLKAATGEDRRFCFEVKTKNQSMILQAETPEQLTKWIEVFEASKKRAFETTSSRLGDSDPAFSITAPSIIEFSSQAVDTHQQVQLLQQQQLQQQQQALPLSAADDGTILANLDPNDTTTAQSPATRGGGNGGGGGGGLTSSSSAPSGFENLGNVKDGTTANGGVHPAAAASNTDRNATAAALPSATTTLPSANPVNPIPLHPTRRAITALGRDLAREEGESNREHAARIIHRLELHRKNISAQHAAAQTGHLIVQSLANDPTGPQSAFQSIMASNHMLLPAYLCSAIIQQQQKQQQQPSQPQQRISQPSQPVVVPSLIPTSPVPVPPTLLSMTAHYPVVEKRPRSLAPLTFAMPPLPTAMSRITVAIANEGRLFGLGSISADGSDTIASSNGRLPTCIMTNYWGSTFWPALHGTDPSLEKRASSSRVATSPAAELESILAKKTKSRPRRASADVSASAVSAPTPASPTRPEVSGSSAIISPNGSRLVVPKHRKTPSFDRATVVSIATTAAAAVAAPTASASQSRRNSIDVVPTGLARTPREVFPSGYPVELAAQHSQFRLLFPFAPLDEKLVLVIRAGWVMGTTEEHVERAGLTGSGRIYITSDHMYFYGDCLGLPSTYSMSLDSILEISWKPGREMGTDWDAVFMNVHLPDLQPYEPSLILLKAYLEDTEVLVARLHFLIDDLQSEEPLDLLDMVTQLADLDRELDPSLLENHRPGSPSSSTLLSPTSMTSTSRIASLGNGQNHFHSGDHNHGQIHGLHHRSLASSYGYHLANSRNHHSMHDHHHHRPRTANSLHSNASQTQHQNLVHHSLRDHVNGSQSQQQLFGARAHLSKIRRLPDQPIEYTPSDLTRKVAERHFEISAKACFHVLFGDASLLFPRLYTQYKAIQVIQKPWVADANAKLEDSDEAGPLKRFFDYRVRVVSLFGNSKEINVRDTQSIDVLQDYALYVITQTTTPWFLPMSDAFHIIIKIVISHVSRTKCRLSIWSGVQWHHRRMFHSALITRQAMNDMEEYIEELAELATDQVRKLGPRGRTKKAIQWYGYVGQSTEEIIYDAPAKLKNDACSSGSDNVTTNQDRLVARPKTLTALIFEVVHSLADSAMTSLLMWFFAGLRSAYRFVSAQWVMIVLLAVSGFVNVWLTSHEFRLWWSERNAVHLMSDLLDFDLQHAPVGRGAVMSRAVYWADLEEAVRDEGGRFVSHGSADEKEDGDSVDTGVWTVGYPQGACFHTFLSLVGNASSRHHVPSFVSSPANSGDMTKMPYDTAPLLSSPSTSLSLANTALRRLRQKRQHLGIHRHDLLVALRVVNRLERDVMQSEWEYWVQHEGDRCEQFSQIVSVLASLQESSGKSHKPPASSTRGQATKPTASFSTTSQDDDGASSDRLGKIEDSRLRQWLREHGPEERQALQDWYRTYCGSCHAERALLASRP